MSKKGGWYGEHDRHALAAKGVKTGRKSHHMSTARRAVGQSDSGNRLTRADRERLHREIDDCWFDFDYDRYYRLKEDIRSIGIVDEELERKMARYESHPTWGKTRGEHKEWADKLQRHEQKEYDVQMVRDAKAGRFYPYVTVAMDDETMVLSRDFKDVCMQHGVDIPREYR